MPSDGSIPPLAASTSLTKAQREWRARKAALDRWSRENPAAQAARGQAGLLAKFEREAREADGYWDTSAYEAVVGRERDDLRRLREVAGIGG